MKALQRLNNVYFITGYLGFLTTWVLGLISYLVHPPGLQQATDVMHAALSAASPHYCLAKGVYDVTQTYATGDCPLQLVVLPCALEDMLFESVHPLGM